MVVDRSGAVKRGPAPGPRPPAPGPSVLGPL